MTEQDTMSAWIPLRDYVVKGERKERIFVNHEVMDPSVLPYPDTWVFARDYWVNGVRKDRSLSNREDSGVYSEPFSQKNSIPPEAWLTVYHSLAEVYKVVANSGFLPKVEQFRKFNRQDFDSGLISNEEHQHRNTVLNEIMDSHLASMDDIISWYLDTYFRVFDSDV